MVVKGKDGAVVMIMVMVIVMPMVMVILMSMMMVVVTMTMTTMMAMRLVMMAVMIRHKSDKTQLTHEFPSQATARRSLYLYLNRF